MNCKIAGCGVKSRAGGMCPKHYHRWRRNPSGDPSQSRQFHAARSDGEALPTQDVEIASIRLSWKAPEFLQESQS